MKTFAADLFKGVGNVGWDLARILSTWAVLSVSALALYKLAIGQEVALKDYAESLMWVFSGCALFIGGKDAVRAFAVGKDGAASPPEAGAP
ncbi:MAG TPA: hypothetical protein VM265_08130 [Sphingomicrobium sp.]|nr:hypothetical protein [Sphingomicrobium sp.]